MQLNLEVQKPTKPIQEKTTYHLVKSKETIIRGGEYYTPYIEKPSEMRRLYSSTMGDLIALETFFKHGKLYKK